MKRATRNIVIGLVLGLVAAGAAVLFYRDPFHFFGPENHTDERLEEAKAPLEKAAALEEEANQLYAAGQTAEAQAKRKEAWQQYAEAVRLFQEIYDDTSAERSDRLTAAYHIGLIKYARGDEEDRQDGVSRLLVVIRDDPDSQERFEASRVVASWYWDRQNIPGVRDVFRIIMDDEGMRARLTDLLHSIENSPDGKTDLEFFAAHPEFGLKDADMAAEAFAGDDESYWTQQRLYRTVADNVTAGATGAEAVSRLFDWCRRNVITLADEEERDIPTPPYQRLLAGHGTADERAWLFCVLVESLWQYSDEKGQHDYDAMVVRVGDSTLVCVGYGDETRVYDMDMCIPVYGQDGSTPLTLAELRVKADVPLNTGLDGVSYPYGSDDIRNGYYYVPFDPLAASFRQALVLPNAFVKEPLLHRTMSDYRPLYESAAGRFRQTARRYFSVQEAPPYPYNDPDGGVLQLWDVPFEEYQLFRLEALSRSEGEQSPEIRNLNDEKRKRLDAYMLLVDALKNHLKPLLDGREYQFVARFPDAAEWYRAMIIDNPKSGVPTEVLEDAEYYRCLALYDDALAVVAAAVKAGEDKTAAEAGRAAALQDAQKALQKYVDSYPGGRWSDGVRYHLGLVYEQMGRVADAKAEFQRVAGSLECPAKAHIKALSAATP